MLEEYRDYLISRSASPLTVEGYVSDVALLPDGLRRLRAKYSHLRTSRLWTCASMYPISLR